MLFNFSLYEFIYEGNLLNLVRVPIRLCRTAGYVLNSNLVLISCFLIRNRKGG